MIFVINDRGIATPVQSMTEAKRLRLIHGWKIAVEFDPEHLTIAWRNVIDEAESLQSANAVKSQLVAEG